MPISIPTNIAGISIPGAVNGPLKALYGNKYQLSTYRYPSDLGSNPARSHVIRFTIRTPAPQSEQPSQSLGTNLLNVARNIRDIGENTAQSLSSNPTIAGATKAVQNIPQQIQTQNLTNVLDSLKALDVVRQDSTTISLYVPDSLNATYSTGYDELSLTEALGKPYFIAQIGSSISDYLKAGPQDANGIANKVGSDPFVRTLVSQFAQNRLGTTNLPDLALKQIGQAVNTQLQVLFRGVGFRSFQFDFLLTPSSKEEAEQVKSIIKAFKMASAPEINSAAFFQQGMFLKVPDTFNINFFYKGEENKNVHRIGECVLENINVDYAPNGWSSFNDGSAVQTRLTLQFKEIVIVDKNKIEEGY